MKNLIFYFSLIILATSSLRTQAQLSPADIQVNVDYVNGSMRVT